MSRLFDLLFYGGATIGLLVVIWRSMQQRRLASVSSPEADGNLLDALQDHWLMHSQLDHGTATRMRVELADHLADVRRSGGSTAEVIGDDIAAFANDWAASHDAPGPWAGAGWRVMTIGSFIFAMAMVHRLIDLVGDGRAAIGYTVAVVLAVVMAVPIGTGLPLMSRVGRSATVSSLGARLALFTALAVAFVMAVGGGARWLLVAAGFDSQPTPGRWWVAVLAAVGAMAAALWSSLRQPS